MSATTDNTKLEIMQLESKVRKSLEANPITIERLNRKLTRGSINTQFHIDDYNAAFKYCKDHGIDSPQVLIRMLLNSFLKKNDYL
jgi:hypothetical protein